MKQFIAIFAFLWLMDSQTVFGEASEVLEFTNKHDKSRYSQLIEEFRCLKCQNATISDSNAALAKDLRTKVYQQITEQQLSNQAIRDWMVARYGDFVLYEPPFKTSTVFLWLLPILAIGFGFVLLILKLKKQTPVKHSTLSQSQNKHLDKWLNL